MPKYEKREYQVGDYWLSQRENSRAWYRMWFDPDTRQTRRASLGTTDFQEAKQKLNEWFILNQRPQNAAADRITLAQTLHTYWHDHGQHIASAESARISCQYWTEYFRDATIAEITPLRVQEGFHRWLTGKGLSPGTVSRVPQCPRGASGMNMVRSTSSPDQSRGAMIVLHRETLADLTMGYRFSRQPRIAGQGAAAVSLLRYPALDRLPGGNEQEFLVTTAEGRLYSVLRRQAADADIWVCRRRILGQGRKLPTGATRHRILELVNDAYPLAPGDAGKVAA